jgi:hypothetical protein
MPGPPVAAQLSSAELPPWAARHLAEAVALLSPEEDAVVVFVPPGLGSRPGIESWAEGHGLVADFAAPEPGEEGQGELVRLSRVQPSRDAATWLPEEDP